MTITTMTGWRTTWVFGAAAILTLLVACSGSTGRVGSSGDGDGGTDGGGGDAGTCTVGALNATRVCVPGTAKAGAELSLEVDAQGCVGCGAAVLPCKVKISGQQILLTIEQKTCVSSEACSAICEIPQVKCAIPPLAAGTYTVDFTEGVRSSEGPLRRLVVADGATATSCDTGHPDSQPLPIAAKEFPVACVIDADCSLITEGNVCTVCACPNAAIAKTAVPSYESMLRERQSLCTQGSGGGACPPCQVMVAKCNAGTCGTATKP